MRNDPIVITRSQLSQWVGLVGGIALLVGLLALLWQGILSPYVLVALAIGVMGIGAWAMLNPRDARSIVTGRQVRHGTLMVVSALVLIGIVALTYRLVERSAITVDMTQNRAFSLSDTTLELLRVVDRPVQITGFYTSVALHQREVDDQFFRLYTTASNGLITTVYIDPDEQPALAQTFAVDQDATVYVSFLNADGSIDFSTVMRVPRSERQERDLTEALSRLLVGSKITVYFEVSHGGRDPLDGGQEGLSALNSNIQQSGLITYPLDLKTLAAEGSAIPEDAKALIFPRLTEDFTEAEIALIDDYLNRGGALYIMSDALANEEGFLREDSAFNRYLWENYGIRGRDLVVVDPDASGQTALDVIGAAVYTDTQISRNLDPARAPLQFRIARVIEANIDSPPQNVISGYLVSTSEGSYAETDLQTLAQTNTYQFDKGEDIAGPLTTVAWALNNQTGARILLVGDSDFASNGLIQIGGNSTLVRDGLSWLTGFSDRVQFGSQSYFYDLPLIAISRQQRDMIAFITLMLMPGAMLVGALAAWARRMRR